MKTWKRALCLLLTLVMLVGTFSVAVFADESDNYPELIVPTTPETPETPETDPNYPELIVPVKPAATYSAMFYCHDRDCTSTAHGLLKGITADYTYEVEGVVYLKLAQLMADEMANHVLKDAKMADPKADKDNCFGLIEVEPKDFSTEDDAELIVPKPDKPEKPDWKPDCGWHYHCNYCNKWDCNGWHYGHSYFFECSSIWCDYFHHHCDKDCVHWWHTCDKDCDHWYACGGKDHKHKVVYTDGVKNDVVFKDIVKYVKHGDKTPTVKEPTREGYVFLGWTPSVAKYARSCKTYTATWAPENAPALTTEHVAYLKGYGEGKIQPEAEITRAEVATILFRLLDKNTLKAYYTTKNSFSDVDKDDWFNEAVSTLANAGVITGYGAGKFGPNEPISRAELVVMLARLTSKTYDGKCRFVDVADNHWAYEEIALAQYLGWVKGYGAGYFFPADSVTRAEVAAMLNRMLDRDCVLKDTKNYVDNPVNAWYYEDMLEASIAH